MVTTRPVRRIFYATGPGDVISAHRHWKAGGHAPTEVSITFSSQIEDFCRDVGAETYIVACCVPPAILHDGAFTLEHRPKPLRERRGLGYHLSQVLHGLGLLRSALRFRADVAIVDSGTTHPFVLALWRLCGIRIVAVLHNTLWPAGYPPTRRGARLVQWLDGRLFWRRVPVGTLCVSPECARQLEQLTGGAGPPRVQVRAQFLPERFRAIPPPPDHARRPFRILFVGRVQRFKGVMDILEMARKLEDRAPGEYRWDICGSGPDLPELQARHRELGLDGAVTIHGRVEFADQVAIYADSHASIVPTRSDFAEGLAMTAAEAILAGRPVISNPVVPALEVLRGACVEARTDDVDSYVEAIVKLRADAALYRRLCAACPELAAPFCDRRNGLAAALRQLLVPAAGS